jgi:hypothetical protein
MSRAAPPARWKRDEPVSAAKLNRMIGETIREIRVGPGLRIMRTPGGVVTISAIEKPQAIPAGLLRCRVTDAANIYTLKTMSVIKWDGTTSTGAEFLVRAIWGHSEDDDVFVQKSGNGTDVTGVDWLEVPVFDPKQNSRYQVLQLADTVGRPTINDALVAG